MTTARSRGCTATARKDTARQRGDEPAAAGPRAVRYSWRNVVSRPATTRGLSAITKWRAPANADQRGVGDVPRQPLAVGDWQKHVVLAPQDQRRHRNRPQPRRDLGGEVGVQRRGGADQRQLADLGRVRRQQRVEQTVGRRRGEAALQCLRQQTDDAGRRQPAVGIRVAELQQHVDRPRVVAHAVQDAQPAHPVRVQRRQPQRDAATEVVTDDGGRRHADPVHPRHDELGLPGDRAIEAVPLVGEPEAGQVRGEHPGDARQGRQDRRPQVATRSGSRAAAPPVRRRRRRGN